MKRFVFLLVFFILIGSMQVGAVSVDEIGMFFEGLEEGIWETEIHISFHPAYREIIALSDERGITSLKRMNLVNSEGVEFQSFQLIIFAEERLELNKERLTELMEKDSVSDIINWAEDRSLNAAILNN